MALVLDSLAKRFGTGPTAVTALDGVSFSVEPRLCAAGVLMYGERRSIKLMARVLRGAS